jgi:Zn-finger nucleic acid-binding protein
MDCPACGTHGISTIELEENLYGYTCSACEGTWVKGYQYWKWLKTHGSILPEKTADLAADIPVSDSRQAKICIECGHVLLRNKVGHGVPFYLDRCSACGGIWFDKNEWEVLKSRNLHDEIHLIFTAAWQNDNRKKEQEAAYEKSLAETIGEKEHDELKRFKSWISAHPQKNLILGYLLQD